MIKLKYIIPVLIAVPLLWAAVSSYADGHRDRGHRMLGGLDLSQEQREQIEDIHHQAAKKLVQQQADIRLAQLDLKELMGADEPQREKIHAQLAMIADLQVAMRIVQADQQLDLRQLLTPEQRREMAERDHMRRGPDREWRWGGRDRHDRGGHWGGGRHRGPGHQGHERRGEHGEHHEGDEGGE